MPVNEQRFGIVSNPLRPNIKIQFKWIINLIYGMCSLMYRMHWEQATATSYVEVIGVYDWPAEITCSLTTWDWHFKLDLMEYLLRLCKSLTMFPVFFILFSWYKVPLRVFHTTFQDGAYQQKNNKPFNSNQLDFCKSASFI